jgi:hypothetical protein
MCSARVWYCWHIPRGALAMLAVLAAVQYPGALCLWTRSSSTLYRRGGITCSRVPLTPDRWSSLTGRCTWCAHSVCDCTVNACVRCNAKGSVDRMRDE